MPSRSGRTPLGSPRTRTQHFRLTTAKTISPNLSIRTARTGDSRRLPREGDSWSNDDLPPLPEGEPRIPVGRALGASLAGALTSLRGAAGRLFDRSRRDDPWAVDELAEPSAQPAAPEADLPATQPDSAQPPAQDAANEPQAAGEAESDSDETTTEGEAPTLEDEPETPAQPEPDGATQLSPDAADASASAALAESDDEADLPEDDQPHGAAQQHGHRARRAGRGAATR